MGKASGGERRVYHGGKITDIDGDGDVDIVGKNYANLFPGKTKREAWR